MLLHQQYLNEKRAFAHQKKAQLFRESAEESYQILLLCWNIAQENTTVDGNQNVPVLSSLGLRNIF